MQAPSPTSPEQAPSDPLLARKFAVQVLTDILKFQVTLEDSLAKQFTFNRFATLETRDLAFARAIIGVSLRHHGEIIYLLESFMPKGLPKKSGPLTPILLSASAQLLFLEVPAHAAIDTAVEQAKLHAKSYRYAKLANAVLHKVLAEGETRLAALEGRHKLNTPAWMRKRWERAYGKPAIAGIMAAHSHEPALDLSVKHDVASWAAKLEGQPLWGHSLRLPRHRGRIEALEGFAEGAWWVQDLAATLPVPLLGDVAGLEVADICAAPGGKTAQLASRGASVTALDSSAHRLQRLEENINRLKLKNVEPVCAPLESWNPGKLFDKILLDAPCSATGTLRRHPDLPYLKSKADIARLAEQQVVFFRQAARLLKPGGEMVYCVCSLEPEEGENQLDLFAQAVPEMALKPLTAGEFSLPENWINAQGCLRTLPGQPAPPVCKESLDMDGFFAARFEKTP